jgi:hypothetical protein
LDKPVLIVIWLYTASLTLHFALCFPARRPALLTVPRLRSSIHAIPVLFALTPVVIFASLAAVHNGNLLTRMTIILVVAATAMAALLRSVAALWRDGWRALPQRPVWPAVAIVTIPAVVPATGQMIQEYHRIPLEVWTVITPLGIIIPVAAWMVFAFLNAAVILVRTYRTSSLEQRKQIQWPAWSLAAFALIQIAAGVVGMFRSMGIIPDDSPTALVVSVNPAYISAAAVVPLSFAAGILKYRLMDIEVLIRKTALYGLLTGFILAGYLLLAGGLGGMLIRVAGLRSEWVIIGSTLAITGFLTPVKTRLQTYVDKRFFASHSSGISLGVRLNSRITEAGSIRDFFMSAAEEIQREFGLRSVVILAKETPGNHYRVEAAVGPGDDVYQSHLMLPRLPSGLIQIDDAGLSEPARTVLRKARCEFLIPVLDGTTLIACVAIGRKLTNKRFDVHEETLLSTAGDQLALGIRSIRLRQQQTQFEIFRTEVISQSGLSPETLLSECPVCGRCYEGHLRECEIDGSIAETTLPVPRTIHGRYRLEQRIGSGGMGAVYECADLRLNRTVALKIMLRSFFGDQKALRRFDREAKAIASLHHPNIVEIYDFGLIGSEGAYFVMPRLHGRSWRSELEARLTLSPELTAEWLDQVLSGLEAAHRSGIVHCDLKPENLHISRCEEGAASIKILDFGLAKLNDFDAGATATLTGLIAGTPGYVSPEQLRGQRANERSDIFALGILTVESLTGHRPFDGIAYTEAPRWRTLSEPRYQVVRAILARCLAPDPERRIPTAATLRAELIGALRACANPGYN